MELQLSSKSSEVTRHDEVTGHTKTNKNELAADRVAESSADRNAESSAELQHVAGACEAVNQQPSTFIHRRKGPHLQTKIFRGCLFKYHKIHREWPFLLPECLVTDFSVLARDRASWLIIHVIENSSFRM